MRSSVSVVGDENPDMIELQFRGGDRHALRRQRNNPIIKINVRDDDNRFVIVSFPRRASRNGGRHAKDPISDRALEARA